VNEHNPAAIKVYEKVGFKKEGAFREAFFLEGKYYDQLLMGILREEWENSQPGDVD
jgi:RimJ/RimL family protein N-acetyltransferase